MKAYERADRWRRIIGRTDLAPLCLAEPHDARPTSTNRSRFQPLRALSGRSVYQEAARIYLRQAARSRSAHPSRIVAGVVALSAAAGGLALLSMDLDTRRHRQHQGIACRRGARSVSAAPPEAAPQATARRGPASPERPSPQRRAPAPAVQAARRSQPVALASASPSRDEIAAAYQSALKTRVVALEPAVREPPPQPPPAATAHRSG